SANIPTLVRVGGSDPIETLRALDAGARGVIVPHVQTARDAERAVEHAHYPPFGSRGLATSTRAGRFNTVPLPDHVAAAAEQTIVVAQIEHVDAVENTQDIASTERLDAVWLGPGDLSMSLGRPGDMEHPDVAA